MDQPISIVWTEPSQLRALLARFPYMFPLAGADESRAYIFFRGWLPTFAMLCQQIDSILGRDKRDFGWTRIREKFGAPSLSYEMRGRARHAIHAHRPSEVSRIACAPAESFGPAAVAIQEAVLLAELQLREKCIVCGATSKITNAQGPWASLCAQHQAQPLLESSNHQPATIWRIAQLQEC